ncbi:hypothetical protein DFJ73DRAFT_943891 [Zopfochytrium polystomum]|nr:hypothetical protein DFJ73DRAFT_943891 [Zopfochytrium polystomum]
MKLSLLAATLLSVGVTGALATPKPVGSVGSYKRFTNCVQDSSNRVLPYYQGDGFDNDGCINACFNAGYLMSGTEYGGQCYCSDPKSFANVPGPGPQCNMPCSSNPSQTCGGEWTLSVTELASPTWTYWGCIADSSDRVLPIAAGDGFTPASCQNACFNTYNSRFAGVEYGGQCYCAVSLPGGQVYPGGTCDAACSADSSQTCGGTWALSAYYIL